MALGAGASSRVRRRPDEEKPGGSAGLRADSPSAHAVVPLAGGLGRKSGADALQAGPPAHGGGMGGVGLQRTGPGCSPWTERDIMGLEAWP